MPNDDTIIAIAEWALFLFIAAAILLAALVLA